MPFGNIYDIYIISVRAGRVKQAAIRFCIFLLNRIWSHKTGNVWYNAV